VARSYEKPKQSHAPGRNVREWCSTRRQRGSGRRRRRVRASSAGLQRTGGPNRSTVRGECGRRTHTVALGRSSHGVRVVPECRAVGVPAVVALPSRTVCCTVRSCAVPEGTHVRFSLGWKQAPEFFRDGTAPQWSRTITVQKNDEQQVTMVCLSSYLINAENKRYLNWCLDVLVLLVGLQKK
jgi:hypothetical protein